MKLVQISDFNHYIPGATSTGVIQNRDEAILVDTGLDREAGRRILRLLEKNGLKVKAIINTHSHADHFGGNSYIVRRTDAKVYAPETEAGVIQYPYLEPLYLFSAHPVKDMLNRFLMAEPSKVDTVLDAEKVVKLELGDDFRIATVPLPGHSPAQIGVESDGILYCADSVFSERVIQRYKIPLFMDIEMQKNTLSFLEKSEYELYIPCHGALTDDISHLVDINLKVIESVVESILSLGKGTTEEIMKKICRQFDIKLRNFTEYSLMLATVKSYLSYLYNGGQIVAEFNDTLQWRRSD